MVDAGSTTARLLAPIAVLLIAGACAPEMGAPAPVATAGAPESVTSALAGRCASDDDCAAGACCNGACVDTGTSAANCGACGAKCTGGACKEGVCECAEPLARCGGATRNESVCVDTARDPANCGTCGFKVPTGGTCVDGEATCPAPRTDCYAVCVDRGTDPNNCGACGNRCGGGRVCRDSACECPDDAQDICADACVNLESDANNCGACGNRCTGGMVCNGGACECPGSSDTTTVCGGRCTDTSYDPKNCGACGTVCGARQVCAAGVCKGAATCDQWIELGEATTINPCPGVGDFRLKYFAHIRQDTNPSSWYFGTKVELYYRYVSYPGPTQWLATEDSILSFSPAPSKRTCWGSGITCPKTSFRACVSEGFWPGQFMASVSATFAYLNFKPTLTKTIPSCLK